MILFRGGIQKAVEAGDLSVNIKAGYVTMELDSSGKVVLTGGGTFVTGKLVADKVFDAQTLKELGVYLKYDAKIVLTNFDTTNKTFDWTFDSPRIKIPYINVTLWSYSASGMASYDLGAMTFENNGLLGRAARAMKNGSTKQVDAAGGD